jgi:drug/metabolite transporter (DMT)-like permease
MNDSLQAGADRPIVLYLKTALSSLAAQVLAASLPMFWTTFRYISQEKATGLAAVAGGMFENFFSGLFLILFLLFLAVFFMTSRLGNRTQRILLFWVPAITVCVFAFGAWALLAYALRHIPHQ